MTSVLMRDRKGTDADRVEGQVKMEAVAGAVQPHAKDRLQHQKLREARSIPPYCLSRQWGLVHTLVSDFWPLDL